MNFPRDAKPSLKHAQTVRLDEKSRIIYSVHIFRPFQDFDRPTTEVVVPAAGVCMLKNKSWLRDTVPKELLALIHLWTQAIAGGFEWVDGSGCGTRQRVDFWTKHGRCASAQARHASTQVRRSKISCITMACRGMSH